jgi:competence protein ComEC
VREGVVLTLATQLGTWPLTAAIFLQFAPYGLLANLAVVPCVALTMALGVAQLALGSVPLLGQAIANANDLVLSWMLGAVRTIGGLPCSTIPMTPAPDWCIACYDAAIVAAPLLWARGARTAVAVTIVGATLLVIAPPRPIDAHLRVTVLDVGQADGIVIQTPAGHAILVDAGGRLERGPQSEGSVAEAVGERIVVPFLLRHGIHRLDAIVLSHPHGDHAGGLAPVLRKLAVGELLDSAQRYGGHAYQDALSVAHAKAVPVIVARAGLVWRTDDGVTMRFIGPSMPFIDGKNAINDNSVAFMLQYRGFRMLFTGDAGVDAEQRFLREGIDLHADVLKVGHHGSAYSSSPEFIAAVHPQYAIVSVGRHNLFGHPAQSTLDTLARYGARVFRTDNNGAVGLTTDGAVDLRVLPTLSDSASR